MRIAIEARALRNRGTGVHTYTYELIKHLLALGAPHEYHVFYDSARHRGTFPQAQEQVIPLRNELLFPYWLHRSLTRVLAAMAPDVVHHTKADVPTKKVAPTVVTIFDCIPLLFPESQTMIRKRYWARALARAAASSDHILTISHASKADIVRLFDVPPQKVTVTPLATDPDQFKPAQQEHIAPLRAKYKLPHRFVMFVGTRDKRKNVPCLLRAFASIRKEIPHHLVIAGQPARRRDETELTVAALDLGERVRLLPYVPADDLPALYSAADLFVYPSVYEGWGFPPQEAMACGTPVIVSNGGALPEVVGEAGIIVSFSEQNLAARTKDLLFEQKLGETMRSVLSNQDKQEQMRQMGFAQARKFSWQTVAQDTLTVYERVSSSSR